MNVAHILTFLLIPMAVITGPALPGDLFDDTEAALHSLHPGGIAKAARPSGTAALETSPYHNGATLQCSQCHVMHASKQHEMPGDMAPDPFGPLPQIYAGSKKLLKAPDPVTLCLTCHDGVPGIPDVVGNDVNGLSERSAGFFDEPSVDNPRGHDLGIGLTNASGFDLCIRCHFYGTFATASVSCIDCHNPHGNSRVRNLQWASYPGGEPDFGLYTAGAAVGLEKYEAANVKFGNPGTDGVREVTNMCNDFHHHLTGDEYNRDIVNDIHTRHPSYDSERGSTNNISQGEAQGHTDPNHWENGQGAGFLTTPRVRYVNHLAHDFVGASTLNSDINGVFCLSCHKAHGGNRSFGLLWDPTASDNG